MDWANAVFPSLIVCGLFGIMLAVGIGFSYLWLVWLNKPVGENCPVDKNYSREKEQRLPQNPAA
jgi:hypothetical protein